MSKLRWASAGDEAITGVDSCCETSEAGLSVTGTAGASAAAGLSATTASDTAMLSLMLLKTSATRLLNSLTSGSALLSPGAGSTACCMDPRVAAMALGIPSAQGGSAAGVGHAASAPAAAREAAAASC